MPPCFPKEPILGCKRGCIARQYRLFCRVIWAISDCKKAPLDFQCAFRRGRVEAKAWGDEMVLLFKKVIFCDIKPRGVGLLLHFSL